MGFLQCSPKYSGLCYIPLIYLASGKPAIRATPSATRRSFPAFPCPCPSCSRTDLLPRSTRRHRRDGDGHWSLAEGDFRHGNAHSLRPDVHRSERHRDCRLPEKHFRRDKAHCRVPMRFGASEKPIGASAKRISVSPIAIGTRKCRLEPRQWRLEPRRWRLPPSRRAFSFANGNWSVADVHWRDGDGDRSVAGRHFRPPMAMGGTAMGKAGTPMSISGRQWESATRR